MAASKSRPRGTAFFAVYSTAAQAIASAVQGQRQLAAEVWPKDAAILVRMGLHTGEGRLDADASYVGADVHRAARIAASGHGGQVVLSEAVKALAGSVAAGRRARSSISASTG